MHLGRHSGGEYSGGGGATDDDSEGEGVVDDGGYPSGGGGTEEDSEGEGVVDGGGYPSGIEVLLSGAGTLEEGGTETELLP
jgi:hypothetical protein